MITLICGKTRAGKTTLSAQYDGICPVIHIDEVHSSDRVNAMVSRIDGDVVVEGIYEFPSSRRTLLKAYKGKGSRCIFLNTPLEIRQKRTDSKFLRSYMAHELPFNVPSYDEGWDEIITIDGEDNVKQQDI